MFLKTNLLAVCVLLLVSVMPLSAQTKNSSASKLFNRAVEYSQKGDYEQAIPLFSKVVEKEPENVNVLYNLGHCYLNMNDGLDSASVYFERTIELLDEKDYNTDIGIDLHLSLAKTKQMLYKYDDAISIYNKMSGFIDEDLILLKEEIDREKEICHNGIRLMKNPVKLEVHNLGNNVNSQYDDHSPLVSADESILLFTSRRRSSYSQILEDGQFSEKIYASVREENNWDKAEAVKEVLERDAHESGVCLSADGNELYILRSDFKGQNLYVSEYDGETWSEPYLLPEGINSRYNETHASINSDKSMLFFTSDRKGGLGGLDIYMVRKLPNGNWGKPMNLGQDINTEYDEETPMIHPDGKTLFFSSEGRNTMGKFDIFYSRMNADSSWNEPVNMGYPINTPDDDFFFVPTAAENRAYLASSRFAENYGGSDLYMIEYEEPEMDRLAVVKGQLNAGRDYPWDNIVISVKEKGNDLLVGEYRPNPSSGKYLMILEAEKTYDIAIQGESIEDTESELTVTRDMTYLNKQQSVKIGDMMVTGLIPEEELRPKETLIAASGQNATETANTKVTGTGSEVTSSKGSDLTGKYTVQFITLKKPLKNYDTFRLLDANKISVYKCKDGNYRYVYGNFDYFKDAKKVKEEVIKATGFDDPFVRYLWQLNQMKAEE
ncbi:MULTISPECIES: tetratricopeptide repeat protein [unclassified Saccharicrinis]|uniref:tetratricopeptide repeat protein n=1 Tax=unclassified Saccharicrinis TaxID=2646859 RepID=UPI003D33EC46